MLTLALATLAAPSGPGAAATPQPPKPPEPLQAWVDFAEALRKPDADCPRVQTAPGEQSEALCAVVSWARLEGDPASGTLHLALRGENWSRQPEDLPLLGPATLVALRSVTAPGARQGVPRALLQAAEDRWALRLPPGPFDLRVELSFEPRPALELSLASPVAHLEDGLERGALRLDEQSGSWHGGALRIESEAGVRASEEQEPLTLRVVRVFHWGSVPTFSYHFTVTGVREQRELLLPLVGDERVETLDPDRPFEQVDAALRITVPPGQSTTLVLKGHLGSSPERLGKPAGLPFEHWLFVTDRRHPVTLGTDGREIDPTAVEGVEIPAGSRAFFLTQEQRLDIAPVAVAVDEGRGGSGELSYLLVQGESSRWVGNLGLQARLPKQDRLSLRTPAPPHYAERNGTAMRMFRDEEGVLSVQLDEALASGSPMRLQWRAEQPIGRGLGLLRFPLPAQSLHLDQQSLALHFKPGYVPVAAGGADQVEGHLLDGVRIFALLMGLLALVLCRAAGLPWWLAVLMGLLFASLEQAHDFPRTFLFLLLAATAILARLPATAMDGLKRLRWLHVLVTLVWVGFLALASLPLVDFVQGRVHSALHPWDGLGNQVYADSFSVGYLRANQRGFLGSYPSGSAAAAEDQDEATTLTLGGEVDDSRMQLKDLAQPMPQQAQVQTANEWDGRFESGKQRPMRPMKKGARRQAPAEKSMRPVALDQPHLPGSVLRFTARSLLPGQEQRPWALVAGPWLRGGWIFLEALLLMALVFQIVRRAAPLWRARAEVQ